MYHGERGVRTLKELGRSYLTITKDLTRVMHRIKALYRSWAIPCSGTTVYASRIAFGFCSLLEHAGFSRSGGGSETRAGGRGAHTYPTRANLTSGLEEDGKSALQQTLYFGLYLS